MIQSLKILNKETSTILKLSDLSKDIEVCYNWNGVSFSTKNQDYQPKDGFSRPKNQNIKLNHIFTAFDSNNFNEHEINKIKEYKFTRDENLYLDGLNEIVNLIFKNDMTDETGDEFWDSVDEAVEKRDLEFKKCFVN